MAIVSVLWSLALLAAIAVSLSFSGTLSYKLALNNFQVAYSDSLGEAAINRTVLALLDPRPDKHWPHNGTERTFDFGGASIRIRIQDELGKIDLNNANGPLLVGLFQSIGLDAPSAAALVDKILDWRDTNPFKRLNGAKADEYRAAGYSYRPRNAPFQSVDELALVMGMTQPVFRKVEPALTVYSGRQFIDPQVAPREALLALPNLDQRSVKALAGMTSAGAVSGSSWNWPATLKGRAFSIQIAVSKSGSTIKRAGTIRLTGNPKDPFWLLNWQRK